jgi:hypothetical protein
MEQGNVLVLFERVIVGERYRTNAIFTVGSAYAKTQFTVHLHGNGQEWTQLANAIIGRRDYKIALNVSNGCGHVSISTSKNKFFVTFELDNYSGGCVALMVERDYCLSAFRTVAAELNATPLFD